MIAGEASGDLHGSNLIKEIKKLDGDASIRAWGGDLMKAAGANVVKHYRDLAFMGFAEVIGNLPAILSNIKFCKADIQQFQPDVLILIDYPGFNLRIAKWAKKNGLKIIYYISPQVWAWKEGRVESIKKWVDKMLVILPFEKEFYQKWNYKVVYVGHPLVQVIEEFQSSKTFQLITWRWSETNTEKKEQQSKKEIIALLPGSRRQEIEIKLPIMLKASEHFSDYRIIIAQAPGQPVDFYKKFISNHFSQIEIALEGQTYALLNQSKAALVTSGTATLETALFGVPQVVCYKGSNISYQIAKRLVKIKYISLVNLIMDKKIVTELIQNHLTDNHLTRELDCILHNQKKILQIKKDYAELKNVLQQESNASARAAQEIIGFLQANV